MGNFRRFVGHISNLLGADLGGSFNVPGVPRATDLTKSIEEIWRTGR
jgi:hypothetical protein